MNLTVELDVLRHAPGDAVRGAVVCDEGGQVHALEVDLLYTERTADYREVARTVSGGVIAQGYLTPGSRHAFSVILPPDALPGVATPQGSLAWTIEARADGGRTRASASVPVEVAVAAASDQ